MPFHDNRIAQAQRPEAGAFVRIYDPSVGEARQWYINDHCFIRGRDGMWHLFGITHEEPLNPSDEKQFAHATSPRLSQPSWTKQPMALVASPEHEERHLWAPHVIWQDGLYYMFYCAGGADSAHYRLHLATSPDLWHWTRHPANPLVIDGFDARDPMVLRIGKEWVLYYTATSEPKGGLHIVACRTSRDLTHWGPRRTVFTDRFSGTFGGGTESPFVVHKDGWYYLFIGPRAAKDDQDYGRDYDSTQVFASRDPFHFPLENAVAEIGSHAAEVVQDEKGKWYVSRCGWGRGGVYLAPLTWKQNSDKATGKQ